ncbi:DUF4261 domain-containing protein [Roseimaritima ulvae]|uniref:DUF4261 domain-containing protein n=1 Tax=Roseimaritima ulvae TaxID=980254 RepID=UPI000835D38A|nr:DUF4261 domain-containing protein [Roseimaritima ulvae]
MVRGIYTQGAAVLLAQPVDFSQVQSCLSGFELATTDLTPGQPDEQVLLLKDDQPGDGHAVVIYSNKRWPDDYSGLEGEPEMAAAWARGQYGPLAFPGDLQRAIEQSWRWDEGREEAASHVAHLRILYRYPVDSQDDEDAEDRPIDEEVASEILEETDSVDELHFITRVISRLLELPEAICYFNPGGEVLMNAEDLRGGLNEAWQHDLVPVDMWTNVRLFRATETWTLMDTIGNEQFDLPDMEVIFENEQFDPSEIESFLRNVVLCVLLDDIEISDGDTVDGPGQQIWQALLCNDGLNDPPRPTIRWYLDTASPPEELMEVGQDLSELESELERLMDSDEQAADEEDEAE